MEETVLSNMEYAYFEDKWLAKINKRDWPKELVSSLDKAFVDLCQGKLQNLCHRDLFFLHHKMKPRYCFPSFFLLCLRDGFVTDSLGVAGEKANQSRRMLLELTARVSSKAVAPDQAADLVKQALPNVGEPGKDSIRQMIMDSLWFGFYQVCIKSYCYYPLILC